MSFKIDLPSQHVPLLKEYYLNRLHDLQSEIDLIQGILIQLDMVGLETKRTSETVMMMKPLQTPKFENVDDGGYNKNWTLIEKIRFFLHRSKEPLTTGQLTDFIKSKEPEVSRMTIVRNVSSILNVNAKKGKIRKSVSEKGENVFSLINYKASNILQMSEAL